MYLARYHNGRHYQFMAARETEDRLAKTCFRGLPRQVALAGNFAEWRYLREVIEAVDVDLIGDMETHLEQSAFGTHYFTTIYPAPVGWESTDDHDTAKYPAEVLEQTPIGSRGTGLKVKREHTELRAPRTDQVTVVYELKRDDPYPTAIIWSVYPGMSIGSLRGDVSARENCVFFDWGHPGEEM